MDTKLEQPSQTSSDTVDLSSASIPVDTGQRGSSTRNMLSNAAAFAGGGLGIASIIVGSTTITKWILEKFTDNPGSQTAQVSQSVGAAYERSVPILAVHEGNLCNITVAHISDYIRYKEMPHPGNNWVNYLTPNDPTVKILANQITKNVGSLMEKQQLILNYVRTFYYDGYEGFSKVSDVRYPMETIFERTGDCEDVAILCASLIRAVDIPCVQLVYDDHIAVGVTGNYQGICYSHNNEKYYFTECTSDHYGPQDSRSVPDRPIGQAWGKYLTETPNIIECP